MKGLRAVLLCVGVALGIVQAGSAGAQEPADANSLKSEYDALFKEMLAKPENLDVMFRFAEIAMRLGNYEAAISTLERMLLYNPDLPRVRLELGVLYFRLGSLDASRSYLERAISGKGVPPDVRARVLAFLEEIDRRQSRNRLSGSVLAGLRYQSNANAGPSGSIVRAAGLDAILEDQFLEQEDFNFFTAATLQHDYDLHTQKRESWRTIGRGYFAKQNKLDEFDVSVVDITTGPNLIPLSGSLSTLSVRPYFLANHVTLDRKLYFYTLGGGVQVRKPIGARVVLDSGYEYRHKKFNNTTRHPNSTDQNGDEHSVNFGGRIALSRSVLINAGLSFTRDSAETGFNSSNEYSGSIGLSVSYDAPFAMSQRPWQAAMSVYHSITDFDSANPVIDPNIERFDRQWKFTATNSFAVTRSLNIFLQLQYVINNSNLSNFEYTNTAVLLGGSLQF